MKANGNAVFQTDVSKFFPLIDNVSSFTPYRSKIRVNMPRSAWVIALEKRFDDIAALPRGWDGYRGKPVLYSIARFAETMLDSLCNINVPPPQLVPGVDGTLQFEWHRNSYDVEVDILAPYDVIAFRRNTRSGEFQELHLQDEFSPLNEWISALVDEAPYMQSRGA